jgi:putative DNA primase/helicase
MADMQLVCREELIMDGEIHRFKNGDDHRKNSWYVMYHDHGAFGCWKMGEQGTWCLRKTMTREQQRALRRQMKRDRMRRQILREDTQQKVALGAQDKWDSSQEITMSLDHPYLMDKGITPIGLKTSTEGTAHLLIVPMYWGNELWNLQKILPGGRKLFLKGGRIKGCSVTLSRDEGPTERTYLCEGVATAHSVFEATGKDTVCAFSAGNMLAVARQVTQRFSSSHQQLIIAADNDEAGLKAGHAVMHQGYGNFMSHPPDEGMDWNDFHQAYGINKIRQEF